MLTCDVNLELLSLVGGAAGFLIALTIMRPISRTTFFGRFFSACFLGWASTAPVLNFMGYPVDKDNTLIVSCVIGAFGWFVFSIILKTVAGAKTFKELITAFWTSKK